MISRDAHASNQKLIHPPRWIFLLPLGSQIGKWGNKIVRKSSKFTGVFLYLCILREILQILMSLLPHHYQRLRLVTLIFLLSWTAGTFALHYFEQWYPIWESYFNAFYFTVITTATIGFGDLVPITIGGKIVTMLYAVFYVPLFLYVMTLLYQNNIEKLRTRDMNLEHNIHKVEADVEAIIENTAISNIENKKNRKKS